MHLTIFRLPRLEAKGCSLPPRRTPTSPRAVAANGTEMVLEGSAMWPRRALGEPRAMCRERVGEQANLFLGKQ
nr:hypothetical protein CFP56_01059 [Quercus suber]